MVIYKSEAHLCQYSREIFTTSCAARREEDSEPITNRQDILPENLEAHLFLHVNHSFRKDNDIQEPLNSLHLLN